MVQPFDGRRVVDLAPEGPPDKELVQRTGTAVGITAHQIDVQSFQIGRRIGSPHQLGCVEITDVAAQNGLDPVGKDFTRGFVPCAVYYDFARRITFDHAWRIGDLQPQHCLAFGEARVIQTVRLAHADGQHGGQQPALGLVARAGHGIDPVRQMDQRHIL